MKANIRQVRAALTAPAAEIRLYLLYGPDDATAHELTRLLSVAMGHDAERVDLDGATLRSDPARLVDEAAALSLFGGARYIRVSGAGDESIDAFAALLAADRAGNPVVAIAPTLKANSKLARLATDSPRAMALSCYMPSAQEAEATAGTIAREHGLRLVGSAARRLASASGGDRAVMTREIEKLAIFLDAADDRPRELDDAALDAVGADLGEAELGQAVAAVVDGKAAALGAALARLNEAGMSPIPWLRQLARRLMTLSEMRAAVEAGTPVDNAMKQARIFFREEASTAKALRQWNPAMLARALDQVRAAERAIMASASAGDVLADAATLQLARAIGQRR